MNALGFQYANLEASDSFIFQFYLKCGFLEFFQLVVNCITNHNLSVIALKCRFEKNISQWTNSSKLSCNVSCIKIVDQAQSAFGHSIPLRSYLSFALICRWRVQKQCKNQRRTTEIYINNMWDCNFFSCSLNLNQRLLVDALFVCVFVGWNLFMHINSKSHVSLNIIIYSQ